MNRVQSILFLLTFSLASIASPACPANGHVNGTEAAEGLASIINNIEGEFVDNELGNFVCATYYSSLNSTNPTEDFDMKILEKLGEDKNSPNRKNIVGKFLNENHKNLICGEDSDARLRSNEPLLKRAIGRGEYGLINNLMFFEDDYKYNLNHYEIVDGKKETILDYIEKILNDPELLKRYDTDSLMVLHNDFIEYEAKRGKEL